MYAVANKVQRYVVTFKSDRVFVNASSNEQALAMARTKILRMQSVPLVSIPDEDLGTQARFNIVAGARPSLRY